MKNEKIQAIFCSSCFTSGAPAHTRADSGLDALWETRELQTSNRGIGYSITYQLIGLTFVIKNRNETEDRLPFPL